MSNKRFFKLVDHEGNTFGRFAGEKPKQVANKAFTHVLKSRKENGVDNEGPLEFAIQECTLGSLHKTYHFKGIRKQLDHPVVVNIDDNHAVTYKYSNQIVANGQT